MGEHEPLGGRVDLDVPRHLELGVDRLRRHRVDPLIPPASVLRDQLRRPREPGEPTARSASEILVRVRSRVMTHLERGGCWQGADDGRPDRPCFICIEVATLVNGSSSPLRPTPGS